MTHKSNKQYLPPSKSKEEYEREIARLKSVIQNYEAAIELSMIDVCTCPIEGDDTERCGGCDPHGTLVRALEFGRA